MIKTNPTFDVVYARLGQAVQRVFEARDIPLKVGLVAEVVDEILNTDIFQKPKKDSPEMHLVVTFMDNELGFYPLIRGYRIDRSSNTILVLGYQTEPPIRIPLCNVRSWTTEKCNEATDGQAAARYSESTVPAQA